jgi:hypothetical protein
VWLGPGRDGGDEVRQQVGMNEFGLVGHSQDSNFCLEKQQDKCGHVSGCLFWPDSQGDMWVMRTLCRPPRRSELSYR